MIWGWFDRNIYARGWLELMDLLFVRASERVHYLRNNLYFEEWQALGNLLLHRFTSCAYFPIQLSKSFAMFCLFRKAPDNSILQSFLHCSCILAFLHLSATENEVGETALSCNN